jgi:peroxiredoxin Q/BCP
VLSEGDKAPEFTLADQNGKEVEFSDLQGQTMVLYFYPRADTLINRSTSRGSVSPA